MKLFKKYIIISLILLMITTVSTSCFSLSDNYKAIDTNNSFRVAFVELLVLEAMKSREPEVFELFEPIENSYGEQSLTWVMRDSDGNEIESGATHKPEQQIKFDEEGLQNIVTSMVVGDAIEFIGVNPSVTPEQIIESASAPPEESTLIAEEQDQISDAPSEDQTDTNIGDGGKDKNDGQPADQIDDPDLPDQPDVQVPDDQPSDDQEPADDQPSDDQEPADDQPSDDQEQPHHEHDVFTYYQEDFITSNDTMESITITVNIATDEVYGYHYFEGYIGDGYRTATYEFDTLLDSSNSFSVESTATIYEDGQDIGEGTLTITGELNDDLSFIAGDIIDEIVGYGAMYYAPLVTQTEEDPSSEDY